MRAVRHPGGKGIRRPRVAVVCEYTAGHVAFYESLREVAGGRDDVDVTWLPLAFRPDQAWARLPGVRSNWSVRASLLARQALAGRHRELDAVLLHTQTAALLAAPVMRRVPTLLSLDATPLAWDAIGAAWGHARAPRPVEEAKRRWTSRCLRSAAEVLAWSEWTRRSLIEDYGIDGAHIHVQPSGVHLPPPVRRTARSGPVRLLFVGREVEPKGGLDLLEALQAVEGWELDMVTQSDVTERPGVRVHRGLTPTHPALAELYRQADIAVLPTHGDCSPFAILEAMAAGLPVVSTRVGAIDEMVADGHTGFLVPSGDVRELRRRLTDLIGDPALRARLGDFGRARAAERFDATRNYSNVFDRLVAMSATGRRERAPATGSERLRVTAAARVG